MVSECCTTKCCEKLPLENQIELFDSFYNGQVKSLQDAMLSKYMELKGEPKRKTMNPKKQREHTWLYNVFVGGAKIQVCRKFILNLFQISIKRLRVIQQKMLLNESFEEKRGTHSNRPRNITDDVTELMGEHLASIPHDESHYCKAKSNLLYFDNTLLNIKGLYELFKEYYREKSSSTLKMNYKTYYEYFKTKFSYAIRKPKTDVCDFCEESKNKLKNNPNDPCRPMLDLHKRKVRKRKHLHDYYITKCKEDPSYLVLEFDYSQNFPIPKLNVNTQFYKRMFWLYCFNIHVFNDDSSYCYTFTECDGNKNPNSVVSFLYDCLKKQNNKFPELRTVAVSYTHLDVYKRQV